MPLKFKSGRRKLIRRQRLNTFPVAAFSTLSAPIASTDVVGSQLPTVTDLGGDQVQFPTHAKFQRSNARETFANLGLSGWG